MNSEFLPDELLESGIQSKKRIVGGYRCQQTLGSQPRIRRTRMPTLSPKLGSSSLESEPALGADTEVAARLEVSLWFQQAVDAGLAVWRMSANGDSEVHFNSGDAFVLTAHGISRLGRLWPQENLS